MLAQCPSWAYFRTGAKHASSMGGLNDLENSEHRGSAGWYGNQHVRLRRTQINACGRSARLESRSAFEPRRGTKRKELRGPFAKARFDAAFRSLIFGPLPLRRVIELQPGQRHETCRCGSAAQLRGFLRLPPTPA